MVLTDIVMYVLSNPLKTVHDLVTNSALSFGGYSLAVPYGR